MQCLSASFCTVSQMIDTAQVIFICFHREHLETTDYTNINRTGSLLQRQSTISLKISCWPRGKWNTVVKAKLCVLNFLLANMLDFLPFSCRSLLCSSDSKTTNESLSPTPLSLLQTTMLMKNLFFTNKFIAMYRWYLRSLSMYHLSMS